MTDVHWQTSGTDDMQPDAAGQNKNIIPNVDAGNPTVGTAQNPWHGLVIRTANLFASIFAWFGEDRTLFGFDAIPSITIIKARTAMQQHDDESTLASRYTCRGAGVCTYLHNRVLHYQPQIYLSAQ